MTGHGEATLGGVALSEITGFVGNDGAVSMCDDTTPQFPESNLKAGIVTVLGWVLAWRPGLAIILGKLVLRVWPNFRRV
jgi:hypothetical protein